MQQAAAARAAELDELAQNMAAAQQKLADELRWVDEEHMRTQSEAETKVSTSLEAIRTDTSSSIEHIVNPLIFEELLNSNLIHQVKLLPSPSDDVSVTFFF